MERMSAFAERVAAAAGYSANIEMVPQAEKLGGNGPIMADGLCAMSSKVTYAGAIGHPHIHPVFESFAAACEQVISLADPASTHAFEFVDGKLLMGEMQSLRTIDWHHLIQRLPEEALLNLLSHTDLIACVNWTMLFGMNSILKGFQDVLPRLDKRLQFFVDLADPRKRTKEDVIEVCHLITGLQQHADVIFGMNEQESAQVEAHLLGETDMDLRNRAIRLREALDLSYVVIHPLRSACVATRDGVFSYEGPYTAQPKLTTGAGDTFNAGFCRGLLAGLDPNEALGTGMCASGFYVRQARPPMYEELAAFMHAWAQTDCGEIE